MQREFSAGGIVYKKVKSLPRAKGGTVWHLPKSRGQSSKAKSNQIVWLMAQHSQHKGWVFPKGLIGDHKDGESSEETAVREVEEETGVKAKILAKLKKPATYFYVWQKEKRFKTVYYFLMEYISGDITNHDFEMSQVEWIPTEKVLDRLSYKSDKQAFEEALELLLSLPS